MNVSIVPGGTGSDFAPFPGTSYRATFIRSLRDDLSRRTSFSLYPDAHPSPYIPTHIASFILGSMCAVVDKKPYWNQANFPNS